MLGDRQRAEVRSGHWPRRAGRSLLAVLALGLLSACTTVGPDYAPPKTQMPDAWHQKLSKGLAEGKADLRIWWTKLGDAELDRLIERATRGNLDLKQSIARIQRARALRGEAAGEELPQVDASGLIEYGRVSEGTAPTTPGRSRVDTLYNLGMDSTWEIDLWGRIARGVQAADADLQASVEDYRDVLVSLYGEVAATYVDIRTLQARIASALNNVRTQRETLRLVRERRRAGLASDLDLAQAQLNLARTEASVPLFRRQLANRMHALGVLLGERPAVLYAELSESAPIPEPPKEVVIGLPAELLRQRPDVRRAERQLAAQTARIGVATADLYPRFSLFGFFAFESFTANMVFNGGSLSYGIGPSVQWNIFDGGRVRSRIDAEDARTQEFLVNYEQTVLNALREVEDNIANYVQEQERRDALARSVGAARNAVRLVRTLYVTGLTDFQNVQDTERNLFVQEDELAVSQGNVARFLVQIYRSLGGGWGPEATAAAAADTEPSTGDKVRPALAGTSAPGSSGAAKPAADDAAAKATKKDEKTS